MKVRELDGATGHDIPIATLKKSLVQDDMDFLSSDEIGLFLAKLDKDGDGMINYEEFIHAFFN